MTKPCLQEVEVCTVLEGYQQFGQLSVTQANPTLYRPPQPAFKKPMYLFQLHLSTTSTSTAMKVQRGLLRHQHAGVLDDVLAVLVLNSFHLCFALLYVHCT